MTDTYEMRLRDLWDVLRRRRRVVLGALTLGLVLGLTVSLFRPALYRGSATITLDKVPPVVILTPPGFVSTTPTTPEEAIAPLDVAGLVELANGEPVKEAARVRLTESLGARSARLALARFRVKQVRQSPLLQVTVDHPDPAVAVAAANAVAVTLVQMDLQSRRGRATELRQAIERQLAAAIPRLLDSENALAKFKALHGDAMLANAATLNVNRLAALDTALSDVRMQQQESRARIEATRTRLASLSRMTPTVWHPSPLITTLENQLATQEIELTGMLRIFTPKYPGVVAAQARIQETKNRLSAELAHSLQADGYGVDPVYQNLLTQLRQDEVSSAASDAREHALANAIQSYDTQIRQLPARELEQARLARATKQAEDVTQILSEKLQQARIAEASVGSAIRVVDAARLPATPVRGRWLNLLSGIVIGLAMGVGVAFAQERIADPLKSADDAVSVLKIPVLASVPRLRAEDARPDGEDGRPHLATSPLWYSFPGLVSSGDVMAAHRRRSRFAEAFRYLRTNLMAQPATAEQGSYRTLLITSPGPGDGKNTVAANLSIALAKVGQRVWLVECDLRDPTLDRVAAFQDPTSTLAPAGLTELLDNGTPAASLLRRTEVDNLWVLPAGAAREHPAEKLASERMRAFLATRHPELDVLIAIAPPVLPVADAAILAPMVDAAILVVNAGVTPREAAWKAMQQLQSVGARVVGTVVTGVPIGGPGAYDNYYTDYYRDEPGQAWHFGSDLGTMRARPSAGPPGVPRDFGKGDHSSASEE